MQKKGKILNIATMLLTACVIGGGSMLAFAGTAQNYYGFSFDYGNVEVSSTALKQTNSNVYLNCTNCDGIDYGFSATVHQTTSDFFSDSVNVYQGSEVYIWAPFDGTNIYIQGALNAYDAAGYSGSWQADLY